MLGPGLAALLEPIRVLMASSRLRRAGFSGLAERYDFGAIGLLNRREGPLLRGAEGRRRYRARLDSNVNEYQESRQRGTNAIAFCTIFALYRPCQCENTFSSGLLEDIRLSTIHFNLPKILWCSYSRASLAFSAKGITARHFIHALSFTWRARKRAAGSVCKNRKIPAYCQEGFAYRGLSLPYSERLEQ